MAIFPHTLRVDSTFICERQEQAAIRAKRAHVHTPRPWSSRPHIRVEMYVGTHETCVNRVNAYHYAGHTPDAPVLLGAERTAAYRASATATAFGGGRGHAIAKAALVGAVLGVLLAAATSGFVLLLLALGAKGGMTWTAFALLSLGDAAILGGMLAYIELRDYQAAHARFNDLAMLSTGFELLAQQQANEAVELTCRAIVEKGYSGQEWALRHAAAEYDEEIQADMVRRQTAQAKAAA